MNYSISFITRDVQPAPGQAAPKLEARDWRLLAFLIWKVHEAARNGGEVRPLKREELESPVGLGSPQDLRNALSGVRRLLRAVGREGLLQADNGTVALVPDPSLDCDLVQLLAASRERDRAAVTALVEGLPYSRQSLDFLRRKLSPKTLSRRARTEWIDQLIDEIAGWVDDPAQANGGAPAAGDETCVEVDDDVRLYLQSHVESCSSIDPRRMGRSGGTQDVRLPLDDVYVSLVVGPRASSEVLADRDVTFGELDPDEDTVPAMTDSAREGLLLFQDDNDVHFTDQIRDSRWTVIVGKPGIGKTTLLRWLALFNARALLLAEPGEDEPRLVVAGEQLGMPDETIDLGPARLPILVRIADWADGHGVDDLPELIDYLGSHTVADEPLGLEADVASDIARRWLAAGRAVILLDGLDEVGDARMRAAIVTGVERFVRSHVKDPVVSNAFEPWSEVEVEAWWEVQASKPVSHGGNQVVVTSREHGYKEAPLSGPFKLVQARPLDLAAIKRFCHRWSLAVERFHNMHMQSRGVESGGAEMARRAAADAERLVSAIESHPNIRRLADNPLLLTVLAMLQGESERLPTTRLEIYAEVTRTLVERRSLDWRPDEVVDVLGPLALWLQESRPQGHASLEEVREHLRAGIERVASPQEVDQQIDSFVEAAQQQAGLLVEVGAGRYGFMHGTFREYFAAMELSRDPDSFRQWLLEHLHAPRWIEVALLGVAAIAKNHPGKIDALLNDALDQQPELEALLHHDLLFVATCLAESVRSSPALTSGVVCQLLQAGSGAEDGGFDNLRGRIVQSLVGLKEARPRVVLPTLIEALEDPGVSPVATEILADAPAETPGLLEGLDHACQQSDRSSLATVARARVASELYERQQELPEHLLPLETLFVRYEQGFAALSSAEPLLAEALEGVADRVQPMLHGLIRWLLAHLESQPEHPETGELLMEKVCVRIFESLGSARGADFSAVARFAFSLDPQSTCERLAGALESGDFDQAAAARYLASHPEALLPRDRLGDWLERLDAEAATALLERHHPAVRAQLLELAWKWLEPGCPPDARRYAQRLLSKEATHFGWLPASARALETIEALFESEEDGSQRLAEGLLATLRLAGVSGGEAKAEITALLEAILADDGDPRAKAAAVMLAELSDRPLDPDQYDLLADTLAGDEALRPRVFSVLSATRPATAVSDEVLLRSRSHAEAAIADGDPAAGDLQTGLVMKLWHEDADRVLAAINDRRPWARDGGILSRAAMEAAVRASSELEPELALELLDACRGHLRANQSVGNDLGGLEAISLGSPNVNVKAYAATLAAGEASLSGQLDWLAGFLAELGGEDHVVAANALCTAAHCLPSARVLDHERAAIRLRSIGQEVLSTDVEGQAWPVAGAQLATDVLVASSPGAALDLLAERTVGHQEMAQSILFALATDHNLPAESLDQPITSASPLALVIRRISDVTGHFCMDQRGMAAIVEQGCLQLEQGPWPNRRACLLALNAAAAASPAQFLKAARKTSLREKALAAGGDPRSISTRRFVVTLLSHFRVLDQPALDLITAACRDFSVVSSAVIERCRTFENPDELDATQVLHLLGLPNAKAVEAAAVLISNLARTAPSTPRGAKQHQKAVTALTTAASSSDPILDCFGVADDCTLRQWLHERLAELVWEAPHRSDHDSALGTTATRLTWDFSELNGAPKQVEPSPRTTSLANSLRVVAGRNGTIEGEGPVALQVGDTSFSPTDLGLADLSEEGGRLLCVGALETLEMRVGVKLSSRFSDTQIDEFEALFEANDDSGALTWLESNAPDYKDVVHREAVSLVDEISASRVEIQQLIEDLMEDIDKER